MAKHSFSPGADAGHFVFFGGYKFYSGGSAPSSEVSPKKAAGQLRWQTPGLTEQTTGRIEAGEAAVAGRNARTEDRWTNRESSSLTTD